MATIYRFIVENRTSESSGRKSSEGAPSKKSAAKKGKWVSILAGEKGGVEHNRKMRAINPLLNKITGGGWEKGLRLTRAAAGLVKVNTETGGIKLSGSALAIILMAIIQAFMTWQKLEYQKAQKQNEQNYKQLENGVGAIRSDYKITTNLVTGRQYYNQNK